MLASLGGCSNTETKKDCQLEAFDLSICDRSTLASVAPEGIWHVVVNLNGVPTTSALSMAPDGHLFGVPITERQTQGDTFFLAADYQDTGYPAMRFALAACQAPSAQELQGQFRRCSNGAEDLSGAFDAVRVTRRAGEAESSGVRLVSETALPHGTASDVFVAGGYAYVTALADGLFIYDVKDPSAPQKVAEILPTKDVWHQAWVKDQTLYIASNNEGLLVYDVSNPQAPRRVGAFPSTSVQVWGLAAEQDRLYAISPSPQAEVLVFDIKSPQAPVLASRWFADDSNITLGEIPVNGAVLDNRLYLAHWRYGLAVADVTDATSPQLLGHFPYDNAASRSVAVGKIGERIIAFESSEGWASKVRALDVTDPAHITEVGSFSLRPESTVSGLALVGTKLYVAHNQDGLRILDVSNPSTLQQVAYYNTWRENDPGRGQAFVDGLGSVKAPGDGFLYTTETSRGLLVFREQD